MTSSMDFAAGCPIGVFGVSVLAVAEYFSAGILSKLLFHLRHVVPGSILVTDASLVLGRVSPRRCQTLWSAEL